MFRALSFCIGLKCGKFAQPNLVLANFSQLVTPVTKWKLHPLTFRQYRYFKLVLWSWSLHSPPWPLPEPHHSFRCWLNLGCYFIVPVASTPTPDLCCCALHRDAYPSKPGAHLSKPGAHLLKQGADPSKP